MFGFSRRTRAVTAAIPDPRNAQPWSSAKAEGRAEGDFPLGVHGGLAIAAAVLAVYGIGFALGRAEAKGCGEAFPLWLSLLIVTALILSSLQSLDSSLFVSSPKGRAAETGTGPRRGGGAPIGTLQSHVSNGRSRTSGRR